MHVLFLREVSEDRLEHVLCIGDLLRRFVPDVPEAGRNQLRLELFVVAALHVPEHQRRKAIFPPERFERRLVHAARGDENEPARLAGVFLHIDLRDHATVQKHKRPRAVHSYLLARMLLCKKLHLFRI